MGSGHCHPECVCVGGGCISPIVASGNLKYKKSGDGAQTLAQPHPHQYHTQLVLGGAPAIVPLAYDCIPIPMVLLYPVPWTPQENKVFSLWCVMHEQGLWLPRWWGWGQGVWITDSLLCSPLSRKIT